jgi:hypothetical protein
MARITDPALDGRGAEDEVGLLAGVRGDAVGLHAAP